ncbi:50S ribosomal protein L15 [Candidatus Lucifugimonas marina]|jgi:large subunit ribosomal protein L15|uniref:Large ribosomal subunit protein uL15 n=1 Tax=Candidatus Lucifugimonas marina TaxID=3038979 RepID=A0AAJ6CTG6_9CHLR|nr:50S ribosomal protein L15 [SAR202 cluster bacterium JH702]MDG0870104.1 50S ribosomal protein L15 [SAR202 cluster bacterium JH639]WFG36335.1 50S ribosomal protein L15 [SAR202 cluster bacterium JH545]WFG40268.1 50S ribosomal protein L15 [SAR202 cluster bacterium JH1073]
MPGLHQLKPSKNSKKNRKRVGRGDGSGSGTFSGRGSKGQKQRGSVPFLFEGGQLPLIKRLPHMRGFTNIFRVESTPVNLSILEEFATGSDVTIAKLLEAGVIRKKNTRVKILGDGDLTKKLNVSAHAFSKSAKAKIEAAGGTVTIIEADKADHAKKAKSAK